MFSLLFVGIVVAWAFLYVGELHQRHVFKSRYPGLKYSPPDKRNRKPPDADFKYSAIEAAKHSESY